MPFPFRAVVLSSAVALVPVTGATAQNDEPQPPTMEQGPGLTPLDQGSSPSDVRIDSERAAVVAAARRTPGVTQIDEDLHTQPGQAQMSDPNSLNDPNRMVDPNGTRYPSPNGTGTPGTMGYPPGTPPVGAPPPSTYPPPTTPPESQPQPQPGTGNGH